MEEKTEPTSSRKGAAFKSGCHGEARSTPAAALKGPTGHVLFNDNTSVLVS